MPNKKDNKKQKGKKGSDLAKALLAGAAVGGGAYGISRIPRYSSNPAIQKAQKASKGKLTRIVSETGVGDDYNVKALTSGKFIDKVKNWWNQAGIKHMEANKIMPDTKIRGAVYDDVPMSHPEWSPTKQTGVGTLTRKGKDPDYRVDADIVYNKDKNEFLDKLQDKYTFSQMDEFEGYTPKSELISDVVKDKGKNLKDMDTADSLDEIAGALAGQDKFIKMRGGEGFKAGFQGQPKDLQRAAKRYRKGKVSGRDKKDLETLANNPDAYIAQDMIKNRKKEYRVHTILQNGEVTPTESHVKGIMKSDGWEDVTHNSQNTKKDLPEVDKFIREAFEDYGKKAKGDTKNQILGVDVMKDQDGKMSIVEVNDNSGSFSSFIPTSLDSPRWKNKL